MKLNNLFFVQRNSTLFIMVLLLGLQPHELVLKSNLQEKAVCWDRYEYIIEKDSWSLIVKEIEITYDDNEN